jgi:hypothetical protein
MCCNCCNSILCCAAVMATVCHSNACTNSLAKSVLPPPTQSRQSTRPFLTSSELGPPPIRPQASVSPPLWFRGGGHTRLQRGWGGPNSGDGTDTLVLCTLCSFLSLSCHYTVKKVSGFPVPSRDVTYLGEFGE